MRPTKKLITVKRDHVLRGVRFIPGACPIALAIKDALLTDSVQVTESEMVVNGYKYVNTAAERRFIHNFDRGGISLRRYKPFKFFLEVTR